MRQFTHGSHHPTVACFHGPAAPQGIHSPGTGLRRNHSHRLFSGGGWRVARWRHTGAPGGSGGASPRTLREVGATTLHDVRDGLACLATAPALTAGTSVRAWTGLDDRHGGLGNRGNGLAVAVRRVVGVHSATSRRFKHAKKKRTRSVLERETDPWHKWGRWDTRCLPSGTQRHDDGKHHDDVTAGLHGSRGRWWAVEGGKELCRDSDSNVAQERPEISDMDITVFVSDAVYHTENRSNQPTQTRESLRDKPMSTGGGLPEECVATEGDVEERISPQEGPHTSAASVATPTVTTAQLIPSPDCIPRLLHLAMCVSIQPNRVPQNSY